jgi:hypothetical protein
MKTMIETIMPNAKLCGNCAHARRWAEDQVQNKKLGEPDSEIVACRLYSLLNHQMPQDYEDDEKPVKMEDMPSDAQLGWADLVVRPGNAPSNILTNKCILVSYKDNCCHFKKNEPEE